MVLQVLLDPVVVDERVVHVDEKDDRMKLCHAAPRARMTYEQAIAVDGRLLISVKG